MMTSQKLTWRRVLEEPFLRSYAGTVAPDAVTTPDVIVKNSVLDFYIGAVDGDKERMIFVSLSLDALTLGKSIAVPKSAKLILNPGPSKFDCHHVFDPAVIQWQGKLYLYYSAIGEGEDSIGLAIADDDLNFIKHEKAILKGRSPEVIINDDVIYLFYVLDDGGLGYSIYTVCSFDGITFEPVSTSPVLTSGSPGQWDEREVTTPRIINIENMYYMIYAGLDKNDKKDIPRAFGLARSKDLINWEKYPLNPVFQINVPGSWDDGAIWFGTPFLVDSHLYLIYEGGRLEDIIDRAPALTQVGLAEVSVRTFFDMMANW
jgi:predicted GH43/DUF377 family glycosyl hydrolase